MKRDGHVDWKTLLAYVTGSVDEQLLLRNEYLVAENRILRDQIKGRLHLSDTGRQTLAEIGKKPHDAYRFLGYTIDLPPDFHRGISSRECRVIRAGKHQVHQPQERAKKTFCCTKSLCDGYVAHEPCHAWQNALARRMGRVIKTGTMETGHLTYSAIRHTIMQWQPCAKAFFPCGFDSAGRQK